MTSNTERDIERIKEILEEWSGKGNTNSSKEREKELEEKLKAGTISENEKKELERLKNKKNVFKELGKDIDAAVYKLKKFYREVNSISEPWAKADHAASKFIKTIGGTKAAMDALRDGTINNVAKGIATNFNVSMEELIQAQSKYIDGIGRNISVDKVAYESLAALKSFSESTGIDTLGLASQFENFGIGIEKSGEHFGKMFSDASKQGINLNKYTDNVAKNIKIAQNYTFKNGVRGLESMAKKATAIKLDMQQIANFAEKVNTVEGALETAAKLQVLGGPFAAIADPMNMLYEGLSDIEGLQDRFINMIRNLGTFDKQSGEIKFSGQDRVRISEAAKATGMDYNAVMESAHALARREEIERQLKSSKVNGKLNEDMREFIKNTGVIKDGKVGISINGDFKTLDQIKPSDLTEDYIKQMTQGQSDDIKQIAMDLRSIKDKRSGVAKAYEAWQAKMLGFVGHIEKWVLGLFDSGFGRAVLGGVALVGGITKLIPAVITGLSGLGGLIKAPFKFLKNLPIGDMLTNIGNKLTGNIFRRGVSRAGTRAALRMGGRGLASAAANVGTKIAPALIGVASKLGTFAAALGPWAIGAAAVAAAGYGIYKWKQAANKKNAKLVDEQLKTMGIERKGKYGSRKLRKIDEALQTGEISDRMRRKLIKRGDIEILNAIQSKKDSIEAKKLKEKLEKKKIKAQSKNIKINNANILIAQANFLKRGLDINKLNSIQGINDSNFIIKEKKETGFNDSLVTLNKLHKKNNEQSNASLVPKDFNININGTLKLTGDNGKSIDIIGELNHNPQLITALTNMIKSEIEKINYEHYRRNTYNPNN